MSNSLGNVVLHNVPCLHNSGDAQPKPLPHRRASGASAALSLSKAGRNIPCCKSKTQLLPNKFLENAVAKASSTKSALTFRGSPKSRVLVVPHATLAVDPASELSRKYNLDGDVVLQIDISTSTSGCLEIEIQVTNSNSTLILHWGALCDNQKSWIFPIRRPNGTEVYKNKALRTPFVKSGSNCSLTLEIEEPEIQAIEFLIHDPSKDKWFKSNGQNFYTLLPPRGDSHPSTSVSRDQHVSLPEELVQTQAYLRWERNGKQNYTPAQEKEEYELARSELLEEIRRGASVEELWTKLTKKPDSDKKESRKEEKNIPNDLVQVQAYIRWEKAGKPAYSSEEQMVEFDKAKKELQAELDKGFSTDELRGKIMKGDIHTKVAKQLKKKKYFTRERIQRKKRDIMHMLNKYPPSFDEQKYYVPTKSVSSLDIYTEGKIKQDGVLILNKKIYKLEGNELLVLVTKSETKTKVHFAIDDNRPLILHWALSQKPGEWTTPPSSILPINSVLAENSCDTPFVELYTEDQSYLAQVEIELGDIDFHGIPFVLETDGHWIKNNDSDFYVELFGKSAETKKDAGDGEGTAKPILDKIADLEHEAQKSFMHRFNIAADLMDAATKVGELGLVGLLVWMRFMATRQLVWNKSYNVKPREISQAQDRLTCLLESSYEKSPHNREIIRMIMSTIGRGGEGDVGQRIRDEILVIQRNNDCKGGLMEQWHQKLHNNTSPDDVVICQALIDFIKSDFDIDVYWSTLNSNGITKERLLSYDRAIRSDPSFRKDQKEGLLRDLGNYMRTLKAVHSGADLESAIATCMGYKSKGEGFMVGVQINPIRGLPSGFPELLEFILDHVEDKDVEPLLECLLETRAELRPLLLKPHERLKDLIFLDIALDSTVRTLIERGYEELNTASPEKLMVFTMLLLENLALSSDDNEELLYCLKGWDHAIKLLGSKDDNWALFAKSSLDRTRLALSSKAEKYQHTLQPSAEYLGSVLGVDQFAINLFTEEIIRAGSAASLSALLNRLDPTLRKVANLGSWQVISPVEVAGYIVTVAELIAVQNYTYEKPTILVANTVKGEEEIPDGTVAVLTPDMPDVLSHVSVRARNSKICFATCFDPTILNILRGNEGKLFQLKPTSSEIIYSEMKENELSSSDSDLAHKDHISPSIALTRKEFRGRYAISAHEFTTEMVGAKSRNIAYLKGKVPSWVGIPTSVALPFGAFEKVLSDVTNKVVADRLQILKERLADGEVSVLGDIRKIVLELLAPPELVLELQREMQQSGMPWPGDEGEHRWEQAWMAIKKVWASKWNERAYFSVRKVKLDHDYLCMAVLVQEIISADYAFVIHTTNPSSEDSSEIYAEVVRGLGETLVGAYPGRALSFTCKKNDLGSPLVLGYPSKPIGLFIKPSLIFRSDSNGEDLEGYAGAGLYDSVPMDDEERVVLDYASDALVVDAKFCKSMLSSIAQAGCAIEELYGSPQDIEGVVKDGKIFVVQTRPQM